MAELSRLLQEVHSPPAASDHEQQQQQQQYQQQVGRCNYDDFCRLKGQAPAAARAHFTVQNFLKVRDHGRIETTGVAPAGSSI